MAPLEAVDGTEIADRAVREADAVEVGAAAVAVPDLDARGGEGERRGAAGDEPEEFGTAQRKTRLVVRRGRRGVPSGVERVNFGWARRGSRCLCRFWKGVVSCGFCAWR
jgi:hypothetical protein